MKKKNQAETTHQNWPKRLRAETTQAETTQAETTHGRNDPFPLLQLVVCRVAALKIIPVHHTWCRLYFPFGPLRNQKIIIGLDSFSNQRLIYLAPFDHTSLCIDYPVEICKITVILFGSMLPNL